MDAIFMNFENSRTSQYHVLVLNLTHKLDLIIGQKSIALSNLSISYTWKNIKSSYNNNNNSFDYFDKSLIVLSAISVAFLLHHFQQLLEHL